MSQRTQEEPQENVPETFPQAGTDSVVTHGSRAPFESVAPAPPDLRVSLPTLSFGPPMSVLQRPSGIGTPRGAQEAGRRCPAMICRCVLQRVFIGYVCLEVLPGDRY